MTADQPSLSRELFKLAEVSRGLGTEQSLELLLWLVHLRHRSMQTAAGEPWRGLMQADPSRVVEALAANAEDESGPRGLNLRVGGNAGALVAQALRHVDDLLERRSSATGDVRAAHREVFEALLAQSQRMGARSWEASVTSERVAELMVSVCREPLGAVVDPAVGLGSALIAAKRIGADSVEGWDINQTPLAILHMRADLAGVEDLQTHSWNTLAEATDKRVFDTVLLAPPWGTRARDQPVEIDLPVRVKGQLDLVWAILADRLRRDGQAVVHLPMAPLTRGADVVLRAELLPSVEAVLALPPGAGAGTGIRSALVLLGPLPAGDILMVSLESAARSDAGELVWDEDAVADALGRLASWRSGGLAADLDKPGVCKVTRRDALGEDLGLYPSRYVGVGPVVMNARPAAAGRLLHRVVLENVKSFGAEVVAELAPITLIYGPNAAGKSSLLQALMLAKQSLEEGSLLLNGSHARLGGFNALVHRHDSDREVRVALDMSIPERWTLASETFSPAEVRTVEFVFGAGSAGSAELRRVALGVGADQFAFERDDRGDWMLPAAESNRLMAAVTDAARMWHSKPGGKPLSASRRSDVRSALKQADLGGVPFVASGLLPDRMDIDLSPFEGASSVSRSQLAESSLRRATNVLDTVRGDVERLLREMGYLGPIRSAPRRTYERGATNRYRTLDPEGATAANFLFDNPSEAAQVASWLKDLRIPYGIAVHALESTHAGVGDVLYLELTDQRFDPPVAVSPADVGFGVSQVLPLVVQLLAARDQVVCIEQPEIHLHPRLQSEFAELLIESTSAEGRANQVIAETHSEHILLRLQRRIREGAMDPDDVSVLYVDLNEIEQQATVRRLRLDARGRFLDRWPGGFFDERAAEIFDVDALPTLPKFPRATIEDEEEPEE